MDDTLTGVRELCDELGIDNHKKRKVLIAAALSPFPRTAARDAEVTYHSVLGWLGRWKARPELHDETFCQAWDIVADSAVQVVEEEILRRAGGGREDKASAKLLEFLAKNWDRPKYGDKQTHTHEGEGLKTEIVLHDRRDDSG